MIESDLKIIGAAMRSDKSLDELLRKHDGNDFLGAIESAETYFRSVQETYTPLTPDVELDADPLLQIIFNSRVVRHNANVFPFRYQLMAANDALEIIAYLRTKDTLSSNDVLQLHTMAHYSVYVCRPMDCDVELGLFYGCD